LSARQAAGTRRRRAAPPYRRGAELSPRRARRRDQGLRRGRLATARDGNGRRRGDGRVVPLAGMGVAAQLAQEDAQPLGVDAVASQRSQSRAGVAARTTAWLPSLANDPSYDARHASTEPVACL